MTERQITGSIMSIRVKVQCGGCAKSFSVAMDPAIEVPSDWSVFDEAVDCVRGGVDYEGPGNGCSVQAGFLLCGECTSKVDDATPGDRSAETAAEVTAALGDIPDE